MGSKLALMGSVFEEYSDMINIVNVWHHYGIKPILKNVSLEIVPGELVAIMGPNGMGKSTLLGLMAGVLWPIKGYVEIDGHRRRNSVEEEIAIRKKVLYLPDTPYLPLHNTGREFLLAVGRLYEVEEQRLLDHAEHLLKLFDLQGNADAPIRSYSTGQKKKIGICSALVSAAPILILDEPFSGGLDSSALMALSHVLKRLADRKDVTVVMAVPVPELVESLAHKIAIVVKGEILAYDTADGLRETAGCSGALPNVLEKLIHPDVFENIEDYLQGRVS
ncbi:MAG: ABC transporter ATP-binding protein [Sedimentisphaerales bacterium]|nr:ABC transporter ATP-binding protein [Sedimentisphaerales bacterium]